MRMGSAGSSGGWIKDSMTRRIGLDWIGLAWIGSHRCTAHKISHLRWWLASSSFSLSLAYTLVLGVVGKQSEDMCFFFWWQISRKPASDLVV